MTIVIKKEEIIKLLDYNEIIDAVGKSFVDFSNGKAVMPPPQDIILKDFNGETHVKSAYVKGNKYYCIKIASGFYDNPGINLSSSQGLMILLDAKTGVPKSILLEEGTLTDYRTAAAGAIAVKHLARKNSENVLVIGTGIQAMLQVEFLCKVLSIKKLFVWGRNDANANKYCNDILSKIPKLDVRTIKNIEEAKNIDIVITATPSKMALVPNSIIKEGMHINAIGADMPGKQELDEKILLRTKIITDSTAQCSKNGELQHALNKGIINLNKIHAEIGEVISGAKKGRESADEITLFDSTGLGVQDLAIASYVFEKYCTMNKIN